MASPVLDRARPALSTLAQAAQRRPASLVGILTGLGAALAGFIVVALLASLVWISNGPDSWTSLLPFTALAWAASNGLPVTIAGTTISLVPWGWAVVPVLALLLAHRRAVRTADLRGPRDAAVLIAAAALVYGICVGIAAVLADATGANVLVRQALWQSVFLAAVVLACSSPTLWAALPDRVHVMVRGGLMAFLGLVGVSAVLVAVSLLVHLGEAMDLARAIGGGVLGGFGLLLLQLGYLPVLVAWALAFMTGAPVELSADGRLSAFLATAPQADLPALPILTAIPQSASPIAWALPALVVIVGALLGARLGRTLRGRALLETVIGSVLVTGLVTAFACLLATGSVGAQRLAGLGPAWGIAGLAALALLAFGALPTAFVIARAHSSGQETPVPSLAVAGPSDATPVPAASTPEVSP